MTWKRFSEGSFVDLLVEIQPATEDYVPHRPIAVGSRGPCRLLRCSLRAIRVWGKDLEDSLPKDLQMPIECRCLCSRLIDEGLGQVRMPCIPELLGDEGTGYLL